MFVGEPALGNTEKIGNYLISLRTLFMSGFTAVLSNTFGHKPTLSYVIAFGGDKWAILRCDITPLSHAQYNFVPPYP